eukprot:jgi/Tetstr1/445596/TSEL_003402.t1
MSTKKRPHDDKRVIFFWRLLCLLIVFCRLPFSIVANLIFKAFIWFLDSSLPLPSRAKLTSQLLPELKEEASNRLKGLLKDPASPFLTSCFAHKINGACNAAVKAAAATSVSSFTLSNIMNKLTSCITWTKKSSKGWHALVLACREMRVKAVKFITPVKTRFTSVTAMEDVLFHPCKLVKLAQSNGSHWMLSDALYSIAKLEAKYTEIRNQSVAISATRPGRGDEDDDGDEQFFDHDRRHEVLATLVDPRFCLGDLFVLAARDEEERARRRSSKALTRRYKTEALLPTLLELKLHMEREKKYASTQMRAEAAPTKRRVALCDLDSDDDASGDGAPDDDGDTSEETRQLFASQIEIELTAFCEDTAAPNPDEACDVLVTRSLRNKMGVENMGTQVFIHKNVDLGAQLDAALSYNFGKECYRLSVKPDIKIRSEVLEGAALLDSACAEVTADSEARSTVEARISCAEYVQSLLDDSTAIES